MTDRIGNETSAKDEPWRAWVWAFSGLLLAGLMYVNAAVFLPPGAGRATIGPIPAALLMSAGAGGVYLFAIFLSPRRGSTAWLMVTMIVVACAIRVSMWMGPPIRSADYHRYLWDGAVICAGANPYHYAPQDVLSGIVKDPKVQRLGRVERDVLAQVNHPHLRTIYPPVAEALFAAACWISPLKLLGWRVVLLLFDVLAAAAVLALIVRAKLPLASWMIYLWNPLLAAESYHVAHLDMVAAGLVAAFAWALVSRRAVLAAILLALAMGVRLYPALFVLFLPIACNGDRRKLLLSAAVFVMLATVIAVLYLPALGATETSGLAVYAETWRKNPGAFELLWRAIGKLADLVKVNLNAPAVARIILMGVLLVFAAWQGLHASRQPRRLCESLALVVLAMLLLGPTLWPWYYVGLIPLAAVARRRGVLLAWTALLPLGYLAVEAVPEWAIGCILHIPIWLMLAVRLCHRRRVPADQSGAMNA